ncbi:hypothetical protein SAMD00019534_005410 [Acytostelium subglobosum LB1]|uniref:hypothetical protein n=1 Tax=Acytostelium subglobosum LB1 TaxID=1410327 RepID=UPI000644977F|nr:hypothetical protein SAMD00019534_005410 [Acytostelium subglobosum LB1]GAM17366.1 hypothetical protein SAMD00019534_005410 [Acytostelium subglobosum LB1]|eukprot:XP_012759428.1 hypothetical protein SAMD00019534_005410 [Acytostelium subglobosum LB1]
MKPRVTFSEPDQAPPKAQAPASQQPRTTQPEPQPLQQPQTQPHTQPQTQPQTLASTETAGEVPAVAVPQVPTPELSIVSVPNIDSNVGYGNNTVVFVPTPLPSAEDGELPLSSAAASDFRDYTGTIIMLPTVEPQVPKEIEMKDFTQDGEYDDEEAATQDGADEFNGEEEEEVIDEAEIKKYPPAPPFSNRAFFSEVLYYFGRLLILVLLVSTVSVGYGMFEIFLGCRFVDVSEDTWPLWGKITYSISRIVLNTCLCMYPYILLSLSYGFRMTLVCLPIGIASSMGASAWATYNIFRPVLNHKLSLLPSYGFFVIALLASATYVGKKLKSRNFRHLFMGQFVLAAVALVFYDFFLVQFYITTDDQIKKAVIRVVVHPAICAIALFISRACSSRIRPYHRGTNVFPVLIFMWFSTYYGRFFNSNMDLGYMTGTMAIVSLLELIWRTTLRPRDKKIINAICGYCFNVELRHTNNFERIYRDFLRHEQMYENSSIITATAVYLAYFHVFDPDNLNYSRILAGMAIQFALEWVTDLLSFYIESRVHKLDILYRERHPRGFHFMICFTFFLGMAYSTSRIILINEGKWF